MASTKTEIPLAVGVETAQALIDALRGSCERCEVVGSVRRKKPIVHDVELLLEPKTETQVIDLFGTTETVSLFEERYAALVGGGVIQPVIGGFRLKRFIFRETPCELFVCIPPSQWGLAQVIRTGPADLSHRLVTQRRLGGLCPDHYRVHDLGFYGPGDRLAPTPDERSVFASVNEPFTDPEARS